MTHSEIVTEIQLAVTQLGGRAWKTIPGVVYVGQVVSKQGSQILLGDAYPYKIFSPGEPDLHFYMPNEKDGKSFLLFGKIEVKTKGSPRLSRAQRENLEAFAALGGAAFIAREGQAGIVFEMIVTGEKMLLKKSPEGRYFFEKI